MASPVAFVPLTAQPSVPAPGPVGNVQKVPHDVRVPSREALQRQLGIAPFSSAGSSKMAPSAPANENVTLSTGALAISAIQDSQPGGAGRVLGTEPLWSHLQPPVASLLAAALDRAVSGSGLFYESHLLQYLGGTRTLVQLMQEPQAHLQLGAESFSGLPVAAYGPGRSGDAAQTLANDFSRQDFAVETQSAEAIGTPNLAGPVNAVIHPAAMALVHQQLELLAVPMFRWGGELVPGTPLDWEISEEATGHPAADGGLAQAAGWSTRLVITLPTLRTVELRLSLAGSSLKVHLAAGESHTVDLLNEARHQLPLRLGAIGLELSGVQVAALAPAPGSPGDSNAAMVAPRE